MYRLRAAGTNQIELSQRRGEYLLALGMGLVGAGGLIFAGWRGLGTGHMGVLAAAGLMVLASGVMLWHQHRRQMSSLVFDNARRMLFFLQRDGLTVPLPYRRIYKIEAYQVKREQASRWFVGAYFHDGNVLPLLSGGEKAMRRQAEELRRRIVFDKTRPGEPSRKTGSLAGKLTRSSVITPPSAASIWEPIDLPPLPAWLSLRRTETGIRYSWRSRLSWSRIGFPVAFVLSFAAICWFSARPDEMPVFWALRGFSGLFLLMALAMLFHGLRTRLRSWHITLESEALGWGFRGALLRGEHLCGRFEGLQQLPLYWSFELPRLILLNAAGEQELLRKQQLNPSYPLLTLLAMLPPSHRLEMQLAGFTPAEILLLQEHLLEWYHTHRPAPALASA